ncbi:hypothetical protein ACN6AX_00840 [Paenibacillus polymyxa]|uniref:hypothetical protein n=1 Tax=Paenibacillus polymyxa TaxID=1406 RepID=UPI00211D57C1|nr:hypothetical protein [Paenibacillus polymyxa]
MKKKLLIGLLTVAACFSLGSTSFADSAVTTSPKATPSTASHVITPSAYRSDIDIRVGQQITLSGKHFWISGDQGDNNPIYLSSGGIVVGLKKGDALVVAELENGELIEYYIHVKNI